MPLRTASRLYLVPSRAIGYLRYTVESYDGIAVVSTVEPKQGLVRVHVAPGCEDILDGLMAHLMEQEGISIRRLHDESGPAGADA